MKVLGGSRKELSKYLRADGGRVVYQFTILPKLHEVASGGEVWVLIKGVCRHDLFTRNS